ETGGRALMGYSLRDVRWRLTVWRDRNGADVAAMELYDEQNDPAETVSVADKPENKAIVESLSKHLPLVPAKSAAKAPTATPEKTGATPTKPALDRNALFDKKDTNHDGKLSREEFMANQPDPEAAKGRFDKWDLDKDGFLSREEFVTEGGKNKS